MGRYLGRESTYGVFEKQNIVADGITTTFVLDHQVGSSTSVLVIHTVNGITKILEAGHDYDIVDGGQKIVFASAPIADDNSGLAERLFILYLGKQLIVTSQKLNLSYNNSYSPTVSVFSPMTLTNNPSVSESVYQDLGSIIKLRLKLVVQLGGSGDNKIRVTLPVNNNGSTNISSTVVISSSDSLENGIIRWGSNNAIDIYRQSGINYITPKTYTIEATVEYQKL